MNINKFFYIFFIPISFLFYILVKIKNFLYDKKILKSFVSNIPVISVGNLSVGGTGKTPLVHFLVNFFLQKKLKISVVMRGYKGNFAEKFFILDKEKSNSEYCGDEASWMFINNPQIDIWVGNSKSGVIKQINDSNYNYDLIIVDDGFQHRKFDRKIDIVVLDAMKSFDEYFFFPWGRARESWQSLKRANFIAVTKVNLVNKEKLNNLITQIKKYNNWINLSLFSYKITKIYNLLSNEEINSNEFKRKQVIVCTAIGSPESFFKLIQKELDVLILKDFTYKDHYKYTFADLVILKKNLIKFSSKFILVSEKDAVKLKNLFKYKQMQEVFERVFVIKLQINFNDSSSEKEFYENFNRFFN